MKIINEKCMGCGKCALYCPAGIISINDKKADIVKPNVCMECGHCQGVCEFHAIVRNDSSEETVVARQNVEYEDLKDLIKSNRSIRNFKDCFVPENIILDIVRTLDYTASAKNEQPVKWIVISGKEKIEELSQISIHFVEKNNLAPGLLDFIRNVRNPITLNAPHLLIAYANKDASRPYDDCMIKMSMASLLMHSCGIGSCYLGYLAEFANHCPELQAYLDLDKSQKVFSIIGFGYNDNEIYTRIPTRAKSDIRFL